MASIMELTNVPRNVSIQGKDISVIGISSEGVAVLLARFPDIGKAMSGIAVDKDAFGKIVPDAIAAVIAAGCGKPGDTKAEKIAAGLGLGEQMDLLDEILRLTFPRGIGPFVAKAEALGVMAALREHSPPLQKPQQS